MTSKPLSAVVSEYAAVLIARKKLREEYELSDKKLSDIKQKMEQWILNQTEEMETDSEFANSEPYIFWKIRPKTDATAIEAYRTIRDLVTRSNKTADIYKDEQEQNKTKIGNWLLAELNKRKAKNTNCGDVGKAYKKLKTYANIADWDGFLKWAAENNAADAIQKRVNSTFVTAYYDSKLSEDMDLATQQKREPVGEYPPYLNISSEWEIVITK